MRRYYLVGSAKLPPWLFTQFIPLFLMPRLTGSPSAHQLQVHGHRGCRGLFPENTIPAFLHALQLGVDVLEMDVVVSVDNQVLVSHEPWLSAQLGLSTAGEAIDPQLEREYNLYRMPYAAIRQNRVGVLPHTVFPEQQQVSTYRPLLHEVLRATESGCSQLSRLPVSYSIELKSAPSTNGLYHPVPDIFIELVLQAIPATVLPRVTLLSFDTRLLEVARKRWPTLRLCMLIEEPFTPVALFTELGFVPEVFGPDFQFLDSDLLEQLNFQYPLLDVVPWTINQPADLWRASQWNIAGITTDYPDKLITLLRNA